MKTFQVVSSKTLVASFEFEETLYDATFASTEEAKEFIITNHPEYKDCPCTSKWKYVDSEMTKVFSFYSIGNPIIVEKK